MGLRGKARGDIPPGTIWLYYGTTAPPGWLFCNGQSTTGYSALAAIFGANVPDLGGRAPICAGTGSGLTARTLGVPYGSETVTLSLTHLPSHSHGGGDHAHHVASHTHTTAYHDHGIPGHTHGASHDHGPHDHGGIVHVGTGDGNHEHQGAWEQTAGNPGGYFTGAYADVGNAYAGYISQGTAGPSVMNAESPQTGSPNNVQTPNPGPSVTVVAAEGSATPVALTPPALALYFIIKT
jgi:microcystin-dependent protein